MDILNVLAVLAIASGVDPAQCSRGAVRTTLRLFQLVTLIAGPIHGQKEQSARLGLLRQSNEGEVVRRRHDLDGHRGVRIRQGHDLSALQAQNHLGLTASHSGHTCVREDRHPSGVNDCLETLANDLPRTSSREHHALMKQKGRDQAVYRPAEQGHHDSFVALPVGLMKAISRGTCFNYASTMCRQRCVPLPNHLVIKES